MPSYSELIKGLTPPVVWEFAKRHLPWLIRTLGGHFTHIRFTGDYDSFADARRVAVGYDAPSILAQTRYALLKVKRGEHRWERDGHISDSEDRPWAMLAVLLWIATKLGEKKLAILDFGGSLGTSYYWCRPCLEPEIKLDWRIVEQPEHVKAGQQDFEDVNLRFFASCKDALTDTQPDILLLSGVLHFVEEPEGMLAQLLELGIRYLIVDRTPLWEHDHHRLTVQWVPKEIYPASYPAWFLSRARIISLIEQHYVLRWRAPDSEVWEIEGEKVPNFLWFFELQRTDGNKEVGDLSMHDCAR